MEHVITDALALTRAPIFERLSDTTWRGAPRGGGTVMGSVMICQSLRAMAEVFPNKFAHSFHVQFVGRGTSDKAVDYELEVTSDAKSTSTAVVRAYQDGSPLAVMSISAAVAPKSEKERWSAVTDTGGHDRDPSEDAEVRWFLGPAGYMVSKALGNIRYFPYWFHYRRDTNDEHDRIIAAAYVSDQGISNTGFPPHVSVADSNFNLTLNHSVWFHHPIVVDEWVMVQSECTATANGRGVAHGYMISESGHRIATFSQEVLLLSPNSAIMADRVKE